MRYAVTIIVLGTVAVGGYWLFQSEPVRSLFETGSQKKRDPLDFLDEPREIITPREEPKAESPRRSRQPSPTPARPGSPRPIEPADRRPSTPPDVPNHQVTRVLLGILKAEGLAYGISLSVNDREVLVDGEVDSQEERKRIIQILDRGRGRRELKTDGLVVKP